MSSANDYADIVIDPPPNTIALDQLAQRPSGAKLENLIKATLTGSG